MIVNIDNGRYLHLFEQAPIPYLTLTRNGYITDINTEGALLLGLDKRTLLRMPFRNFVAESSLDGFFDFLERVCREHLRYEARLSIMTHGSGCVPVLLRGSVTLEKGMTLIRAVIIELEAENRGDSGEGLPAVEGRSDTD